MIRWCSFCQRYIGEKEPYENYELTHGICEKCAKKAATLDKTYFHGTNIVINYFRKLKEMVFLATSIEVEKIIQEGLNLGIKPEDLAIGMIQPLLYDIGEMWAAGRASAALEHRVTAHCTNLIEMLLNMIEKPGSFRNSVKPKVLLVLSDGNYHTLGLRIIEIFLVVKEIPSYVVIPGLPSDEVVKLIQELKPETVGISVALVPQLESVRVLAKSLNNLRKSARPRIVVGGQAVRRGLTISPDWGIEVMTDFSSLIASGKKPSRRL